MDRGIAACNCGSTARIRSTVSMMLAPGCREDDHENRGFAIRITGIAKVFHGVDRLPDILDPHRGAVVLCDHQRLIIDWL